MLFLVIIYHRIMDDLVWKDLTAHPVPSPAMGWLPHQAAQGPSSPALSSCRDGASTALCWKVSAPRGRLFVHWASSRGFQLRVWCPWHTGAKNKQHGKKSIAAYLTSPSALLNCSDSFYFLSVPVLLKVSWQSPPCLPHKGFLRKFVDKFQWLQWMSVELSYKVDV